MKKGFKRFLSSVLATVMAVAGMTIGMTTTASAAVKTYELIPSATQVNTDNYFSGSITSYNTTAGALATTSVTNAAGESVAIARGYKLNSSGKITFTTTAASSTVTMLWSARLDKTSTCTAGLDGQLDTAAPADGVKTVTYDNVAAGTHTIARGASEGVLYYVRVDETFSDSASTYTINGTCNLSDTTFTIGDMDAIVDASGNWTATKTSDTAPFAVGDSLTVSYPQYGAAPASVTLAAGADDVTFDGGNIVFTQLPLSAISAGTYTYQQVEAGLPNFDVSGLTGIGSGKYTGEVKFILSDTATVTINGKCGSSDSAKSATAGIGEDVKTVLGGGSNADYVFSNVPAGETTLTFTGDSTTFQVVSITITYGATEESSTEVSTEDSTETSTEAPVGAITDKATLTANAGFSALTADQESGQFVILNGVSGEANEKSVEGLGNYTVRMKTGGKTTLSKTGPAVPTNRGFKFTTAGAGTLQVVAMSGSSSAVRDFAVYASDGTVIKTVSVSGTDCVPSELITLPKADTYYIACPSAACNFYSINVVVGNGVTSATGGSVFADVVDSYAIAKVSAADLANASLDVNIGDYSVNTETVFQQVAIDGHLITAAELGADYIYAVKIAEAAGANFDFTTKFNA